MMRATLKIVALVAGAVTMASLAGCSSGGSADGKTPVTWFKLSEGSETQNATINEVVADFEKANPTIDIKVEERSIDAHKDALRTTLGSSGAPDIFFSWAGPGLGGEFIEAGGSLNLEKYYDKYNWADRFSDATMETVTQYGGFDGVPYTQRAEGIFYNKALFAEAGITEAPTTYDELVDAAEKLKAAGITPIEFGGTVNWHVMRLLDSILETKCGPELYQDLVTGKASWVEEECVTETFTEFSTWTGEYVNDGFISINNDEASALFFSGEAAMALEGDWFNQSVRDNGMDEDAVGIIPFPTGAGRIYGFNENNYITPSSKHPDEAAKFLDYLTSESAQEKFIKAFGSQSVNVNVTSQGGSELDQAWGPIFENATGVYMNNDQNFSLAETTEYWRIQNLVATGELDPKNAGTEFQKFLDQQ
jgi:raffinose/stachyose/melibiose transport system substrate-binding protein